LIKRDILFQILKEGIVDNDYVLTDSQMLTLYLQNNVLSVAEMIVPYLSAIGCDEFVTKSVLSGFAGLQLFQKLKEKFKEFKRDNSLDEALTSFVDKTETSLIYENDIIRQFGIRKLHKKLVI